MLMNNLISWTVMICDCVRALFRYASFSALQWQVIESGADLSTPRAARGLAGAAGEKTTHLPVSMYSAASSFVLSSRRW